MELREDVDVHVCENVCLMTELVPYGSCTAQGGSGNVLCFVE